MGLRRKGLYSFFCFLLCSYMGFSACIGSEQFYLNYMKVQIQGFFPEVAYLRVRIVRCDGKKHLGEVLFRERQIEIPLGEELFYLPLPKSGVHDVLIEAFQRKDLEKPIAYARRRIELVEMQRILPLFFLKTNFPKRSYELCATRPLPEDKKKGPIVMSPVWGISGAESSAVSDSRWIKRLVTPSVSKPELPSSPFRLRDHITLLPKTISHTLAEGIATDGKQVVIVGVSDGVFPDILAVYDGDSGKLLKKVFLPDGCAPKGVDLQGGICAVTCWGTGRLVFLDAYRWKLRGKGVWVGLQPISVRLSGRYAIVANQGSNTVSIVPTSPDDRSKVQSLKVGESPSRVRAVNEKFLVLNSGSHSLSIFYLKGFGGKVTRSTSYSLGLLPQDLAANGWFWVVSNKGEGSITIHNRLLQTSRTLLLNMRPSAVLLLSHSILVSDSDKPRLFVIDLRTTTITQIVSLPAKVHRFALAGEFIWMTSTSTKSLMRAKWKTRKGLNLFHLRTTPDYFFTSGDRAWLYNISAQEMWSLDLETKKVLERSNFQSDGWMIASSEHLMYTGSNSRELFVQTLGHSIVSKVRASFPSPIKAGRIFGKRAYLLHWKGRFGGGLSLPLLSTIQLIDITKGLWKVTTRHLPVGEQPVDIVPWEPYLILADYQKNSIYLLVEKDLRLHKSIRLPASPIQILRWRGKLLVLLSNKSIQLLAPYNTKPLLRTITLSGQPGQMAIHKEFLFVTDRENDLILRIEPETGQITDRIPVSCDPKTLTFWKNKIITTNYCREALAFSPIPSP